MRVRWWVALVAAAGALALVAGLVVGVRWWQDSRRSDLQHAVRLAPADAARLSWTDWADVRREVGADVDADSSVDQLDRFLDEAYPRDLTSSSALVGSAPELQGRFGFSPANLDWELFSQSTQGAVVIMQLPDDTDMDQLGDTFAELGYQRPDEEDGVWRGGTDLVASLGVDLTPELQHLALSPDDHLLLASDTADYLARAMDVVRGDREHLTALDDVVEAVGQPLAASVYTSDYACSALAMSQADRGDQDAADQLLSAAGEVNPVTGMALGLQPGGDLRVAMTFDTDEQARTNADTRSALAVGPAPGQGGDFPDRFRLGRVRADGRLLTMELRPQEGQYVLSDLSSGPVLFLTC